ncbi:AAA domain-containing protein [Psidium guajava]|nr:AAA domain-containing protein [Psidium guajava]
MNSLVHLALRSSLSVVSTGKNGQAGSPRSRGTGVWPSRDSTLGDPSQWRTERILDTSTQAGAPSPPSSPLNLLSSFETLTDTSSKK